MDAGVSTGSWDTSKASIFETPEQMHQRAGHHRHVPELVRRKKEVKETREDSLGSFAGVEHYAHCVSAKRSHPDQDCCIALGRS